MMVELKPITFDEVRAAGQTEGDPFYTLPSEKALREAAKLADIQWITISMLIERGNLEPGFVRVFYAFARFIDASRTPETPKSDAEVPCDPSPGGLEAYRNRRPASASGTVSNEAMEVWKAAEHAKSAKILSFAGQHQGDQAAARIIQQYGDQREAAGYRRGVEDAAKVADGFYDNSMKMLPSMQQKIAAKISALLEPKKTS